MNDLIRNIPCLNSTVTAESEHVTPDMLSDSAKFPSMQMWRVRQLSLDVGTMDQSVEKDNFKLIKQFLQILFML